MTWIVEVNCVDDDYLILQEHDAAQQNLKCWGDPTGPAWLLPYLEVLSKGKTLTDLILSQPVGAGAVGKSIRDQVADGKSLSTVDPGYGGRSEQSIWDDAIRLHEERLAAARQLLGNKNPKAAFKEASAIVEQLERTARAYAELYTRLWRKCSLGHASLSGIPYREVSAGIWDRGERESIPPEFFVDPIFHFRGGGPNRKGELGPDAYRLSDAFSESKGTRRVYAEVFIKRDDVEMLSRTQANGESAKGRPGTERERAKSALAALPLDTLATLGPRALAERANEILAMRGLEPTVLPDTASRARDEIINAK